MQVCNAKRVAISSKIKQGNLCSSVSGSRSLSQISLVSTPAIATATSTASTTSSGIMRRLALLVFILLALLSISLSQYQGFGRNADYLIRRGHRLQPNKPSHHQENMKIRREMREFEISDYDGPKANVNPRSGPLLNPPNPTPPPSH